MLGPVAHVAAVVGEAPVSAQLLKLLALVLREAPLLGHIDLGKKVKTLIWSMVFGVGCGEKLKVLVEHCFTEPHWFSYTQGFILRDYDRDNVFNQSQSLYMTGVVIFDWPKVQS